MNKNNTEDLIYEIYNNPPKFHYWNNKFNIGGFNQTHFNFFDQNLKKIQGSDNNKLKIVETGAGLSSLFFLAKNFITYSFSLSDVIERIEEYLKNYPNIKSDWFPIKGFSEFNMPAFANENKGAIDAILIDGNHSVASVFVDFFYSNFMLKKGGLIFIDDTQLPGPYGVKQLIDFLNDDYEYIEQFEKIVCYRKISNSEIDFRNMSEFEWPQKN
jgi:hypothetical protein